MGEIYPCRSPFDEEDFVGGLLAEESPEQCAMSVENGDGVGDGVEDRVPSTAGGRKVVLVVGAIVAHLRVHHSFFPSLSREARLKNEVFLVPYKLEWHGARHQPSSEANNESPARHSLYNGQSDADDSRLFISGE